MRLDEELDPAARATGRWQNDPDKWFGKCSPERCGFSFSGGERDHLFISDAAREFTDVAGVSGLDSPSDGRGFAMLDFDRDGWLDIAVVNANSPWLQLYRNRLGDETGNEKANAAASRFVAVQLRGGNRGADSSSTWSNRDGVGARIEVQDGERTIYRQQLFGEGFAAQNSATKLIGLGPGAERPRVAVRWPSGSVQTAECPADSLVTFYEDATESPAGEGWEIRPYRVPGRASAKSALGSLAEEPGAAALAQRLTGAAGQSNGAPPTLRVYMAMATWCEACQRHQPHLTRLGEIYGPETLAVYGVPIDPADTTEMLSEYAQTKQAPFSILTQLEASGREEIRALYGQLVRSQALPACVMLNARGEVVWAAAGVPTLSDVRRLLAAQ